MSQTVPTVGEVVIVVKGAPRFVGNHVTVEKVGVNCGGIYLEVAYFGGDQVARFSGPLEDFYAEGEKPAESQSNEESNL